MFTKETAKKMSKDDDLFRMVRAMLAFKARSELIREGVEKYAEPVFSKYEFYNDLEVEAKGNRSIEVERERVDRKHLYLSTDEENVKRFYRDMRAAHLDGPWASMVLECEEKYAEVIAERGESVEDSAYCPACISEAEYVEAKNAVTDYAAEFLGIKEKLSRVSMKYSNELVDLVTKMVCSGPRKSELNLESLVA